MSNITTSEIMATLQRSNAPTLIVEGSDDYVALEQFENENVDWGLTIFPVKGKEVVFEIFTRRSELKNNNIIFLMDKDCWVFEGVPEEYNKDNIVYTDGYSIENDLIRDGETWRIFGVTEKGDFERCLKFLSRFIAAASHHHVSGTIHYPLSTHPCQVFPSGFNACPDIENWLLNVEPEVPAPYLETYNDPYKFVREKAYSL